MLISDSESISYRHNPDLKIKYPIPDSDGYYMDKLGRVFKREFAIDETGHTYTAWTVLTPLDDKVNKQDYVVITFNGKEVKCPLKELKQKMFDEDEVKALMTREINPYATKFETKHSKVILSKETIHGVCDDLLGTNLTLTEIARFHNVKLSHIKKMISGDLHFNEICEYIGKENFDKLKNRPLVTDPKYLKLSPRLVIAICIEILKDLPLKSIAEHFGLDFKIIKAIKEGRCYSKLTSKYLRV